MVLGGSGRFFGGLVYQLALLTTGAGRVPCVSDEAGGVKFSQCDGMLLADRPATGVGLAGVAD